MYIIGENTPLYKLVHRNPLPHPTPLLLHSYIPIGASHFATPRAHTHTHITHSQSVSRKPLTVILTRFYRRIGR
jgi:hypothetical protein